MNEATTQTTPKAPKAPPTQEQLQARLAKNLAALKDFASRMTAKGHWREILNMSDAELTSIIKEDRSPTMTVGHMNIWLREKFGRPTRKARGPKAPKDVAQASGNGAGANPGNPGEESKEELTAQELLSRLGTQPQANQPQAKAQSTELPGFLNPKN
jgi:hypothetical protein